jgi:hypothetical protein
MGNLFYGDATQPIEIPDRLLGHLQVLAATKLRRSESFTFSWRHPHGEPEGRTTIWLQPSIPLRFVYSTTEKQAVDPVLLRELADQAASSAGVVVDFGEWVHDAEPGVARELVGVDSAAA